MLGNLIKKCRKVIKIMNYIKYVNIKQGTESVKRFSNGNTLPLVQLPFGFSSFALQTDSGRAGWFYHPKDKSFEGIRLTHQPSPWIGDRGAVVFLPQSEIAYSDFEQSWSGYDEIEMKPHYLKIYAKRPACMAELTPTMYGAHVRMNFEKDTARFLSVMPADGEAEYTYDFENRRVFCTVSSDSLKSSESDGFKAYYVFEFKEDVINTVASADGHISLKTKQIEFTVAASYISYEQAVLNLDDGNFECTKKENEKIWNDYLGRIQISADEDIMKTFYSCMYRVFLFPHRAYEINADGKQVHYAPSLNTITEGVRYTDNGFWDTYRTVYPLFSIIAKEEYKEMLQGFVTDYIDGGWLPCWTAINAKNCMPSTLIDAVIADAAVKGLLSGEWLETAYKGMLKHANEDSVLPEYGRLGCGYYTKIGYVPFDKCNESVNLTLDAAYGDYCIAVVADILGYKDDHEKYLKRSKNYMNIFDKETGFMRAKDTTGNFRNDFDPTSWGEDYTEAAAWQTTFAVQHDFDGLAELYGGTEKLLEKLDELFDTPTEYRVGGYKKEIHEMTEFAAGCWGQCAISNQPSFHLPFIYAYFGKTDKTNYWVHRLCKEAFTWHDDGFPGDEDNGTMAAWYIFAAIGMYPLTPGKNEYVKFDGFIRDAIVNEK